MNTFFLTIARERRPHLVHFSLISLVCNHNRLQLLCKSLIAGLVILIKTSFVVLSLWCMFPLRKLICLFSSPHQTWRSSEVSSRRTKQKKNKGKNFRESNIQSAEYYHQFYAARISLSLYLASCYAFFFSVGIQNSCWARIIRDRRDGQHLLIIIIIFKSSPINRGEKREEEKRRAKIVFIFFTLRHACSTTSHPVLPETIHPHADGWTDLLGARSVDDYTSGNLCGKDHHRLRWAAAFSAHAA